MSTLEARVDRLETILGEFIVHTDMALRRLEAEMGVLSFVCLMAGVIT